MKPYAMNYSHTPYTPLDFGNGLGENAYPPAAEILGLCISGISIALLIKKVMSRRGIGMKTTHALTLVLLAGATTVANAGTIDFTNPDLSAWSTDRFTPAVFQTEYFMGDDRLHQGVRSADNEANRSGSYAGTFYNYQGMQHAVGAANGSSIAIDLFVDSSWTSGTRAGMWSVMNDGLGNGENSHTYPILEYAVNGDNGDGNGATFTGFRYWDSSVGWMGLSDVISTDAWYTLEIALSGTDVNFLIDGSVVATIGSLGAVEIENMILNVHNQGMAGDYDVYWDDFTVNVVPLPPAAFAGLGLLAGCAGVRQYRRR